MNTLKMINLDITYKCNLACRHCGALINNKQQEELSTERVISLLEEAARLGCRDITIAGGEPFLRDDLFTVLREAAKRKIYVSILTNGTLIDKKAAQALGKIKPYLSYVRISMEFVSNEGMAKLRGKEGLIGQIISAIEHLKSEGIAVGLNTTLLPENLVQIPDIISFAAKSKVDFIRMAPVVAIGRGSNILCDADFVTEALDILLESLADTCYGISSEVVPVPFSPRDVAMGFSFACSAGLISCSVTPEGKVKPCPMYPSGKDLPNLQTHSLAEAWEMIRKSEIERRKTLPGRLRGRCGSCELKLNCLGGCPVYKFSEGLDIEDEQPLCMPMIIESVLKDKIRKPAIRRVLSSVLHRQAVNLSCGIPPCIRTSPFWLHPRYPGYEEYKEVSASKEN